MNTDLKLYVDEKQDDIKYLKEQCDIDVEDEAQIIKAARNHIKKNVCDI